MKFFMQIVCLICITSCSSFSIYSFFGLSSDPERDQSIDHNSEPFDESFLEGILRDEPIVNDHQFTNTNIHSSDGHPPVESASYVMSRLKSMLNSPVESTKKYAAKKVKELFGLLKNDLRKTVEFTLGDDQLSVDLGLKNSPVRGENIKEAKGLLDLIHELFSAIFDYVASWFTWGKTEQTKDKVYHKNHPEKDTDQKNDEKAKEKDKQAKGELKIEVHGGKEYVCTRDGCIPKEKYLEPKQVKQEIKESDHVATKSKTAINFQPFKNLTPEMKKKLKLDVEKAQQQIKILEEAIKELEKKKEQERSEDEQKKLFDLKEKLWAEKEFVQISYF